MGTAALGCPRSAARRGLFREVGGVLRMDNREPQLFLEWVEIAIAV